MIDRIGKYWKLLELLSENCRKLTHIMEYAPKCARKHMNPTFRRKKIQVMIGDVRLSIKLDREEKDCKETMEKDLSHNN